MATSIASNISPGRAPRATSFDWHSSRAQAPSSTGVRRKPGSTACVSSCATICMPLVKGGKLTGLMAIHDKEPHYWSDYELAVIQEVTDRSASAALGELCGRASRIELFEGHARSGDVRAAKYAGTDT